MEKIDGFSVDFEQFIALHRSQLEMSGVPKHFWRTVYIKLKRQIFDAGNTFSLARVENEDSDGSSAPQWQVLVISEEGISSEDGDQLYLVDHAWTFRSDMARRHLEQIPGLLERMASLMDICTENLASEVLLEVVLNEMWKYCQTYSLGGEITAENKVPVWYIMDEFGSRIQHSDQPNFRTVPFIHLPEQVTYTLLFPVEDVCYMQAVTRDYIEGPFKDPLEKKALLLPWFPSEFTEEKYIQEQPGEEFFRGGRMNESLPNLCQYDGLNTPVTGKCLKVYSDYVYINQYLKDPRFEITDQTDEADILWYTSHFKNYKEFSDETPHKFINQFPCEHIITVKDLLCVVSRRKAKAMDSSVKSLETFPLWLPTTYNLQTELVKFVSYYQNREELQLDNHWICKPWNLARGLDTHVTKNLSYIMRLAFSGPKIVQKYIEDPVLFYRPEIGNVKFDIRYILLLRSVKPLTVYAYKRFWLRFANKSFELKDLDDYEKHFTVMNYKDTNLCQMFCSDFVIEFEKQYPDLAWKDIESKIFAMFRELFEAAVSKEPPCGIAHHPQSRAVYAADLMLAWRSEAEGNKVIQPNLLEVNWTPDCQRACEYYPDFYDNVFAALFCDDVNGDRFQTL